jgi:hypothetical protein
VWQSICIAEMVARHCSSIVYPEQTAPLQFRNDEVDEVVESFGKCAGSSMNPSTAPSPVPARSPAEDLASKGRSQFRLPLLAHKRHLRAPHLAVANSISVPISMSFSRYDAVFSAGGGHTASGISGCSEWNGIRVASRGARAYQQQAIVVNDLKQNSQVCRGRDSDISSRVLKRCWSCAASRSNARRQERERIWADMRRQSRTECTR